jgi:hypothetical protein
LFILYKQKMGRLRAYGTYYFDIVDIDSDRPYNYYSANLGSFAKYALSMKEVCSVSSQSAHLLFILYKRIYRFR